MWSPERVHAYDNPILFFFAPSDVGVGLSGKEILFNSKP